ncbi:hypothetical protein Nepgr_005144 [Nepenthes gracilis]|uniref:Uncharacterized protein n=1 Tax=Nepenthes gracilis TaxID=150966 RepID=A0AAD3S2P4_NEPGR|nr:hypothetical protein Nepgr_005144 [Nepenthes gracilis]
MPCGTYLSSQWSRSKPLWPEELCVFKTGLLFQGCALSCYKGLSRLDTIPVDRISDRGSAAELLFAAWPAGIKGHLALIPSAGSLLSERPLGS